MSFRISRKDSRTVRRLKVLYLVPVALFVDFPLIMLGEARDALVELVQAVREAWR